MNGIINVLKPSNMTSHDVVSFIRKKLNIKKVGHTGTLDPNAAGVLPICVGKATRVSQYFNDFNKSYRGELTLGYSTDTQDKYGTIIEKNEDIFVDEDEIKNVFNKFTGKINQIPPMYSALKYKGKKLYELAREGKTIERDSREVTIYDLKILKNYENRRILFDVKCSKGTYVRTLCEDIGRELGTLGHMSFLMRTGVGNFSIEEAFTLEEISEIASKNEIESIMKPLDSALLQYQKIILKENLLSVVKNGGKITLNNDIIEGYKLNEILRVYAGETFIGIGTIRESDNCILLKMEKVLL
ncbi:tRNA pseudouridine synthase B [Gottschalkia purinilytica]|uniref:tRNA pseudouridine synthase B n=1 Tax=Gottschalkia purinilytica TaxID=1503 RepID=A0A0L0WBU8_GOTPU|nr:tRNA pseudouridine(55) synthase TruB [Gottschalkia purinilytica]KNF08865.1 tRNA pseudouridine synthase B [Gottschalkia purinilytica]